MSISFCTPTWRRTHMVIESFAQILNDHRISEIVICDDDSGDGSYEFLCNYFNNNDKVKIYENESNLDCYLNKKRSIELANNEWCIIGDSDNIFGVDYLDKIYSCEEWDKYTIYTPDFAKPTFNFKSFSGLLITKENVSQWIDEPMFEVMCNAANYFVNRSEYLRVFDDSKNPVTSDSIFMIYNWLMAGNKVQVVDGLEYEHRIHSGSHYQTQNHRTPLGFHEQILNNLRSLK